MNNTGGKSRVWESKNGNKLNQYIVVSIYLLSLYTTMMDTNQKVKIINTVDK
jgi:hypothetical protein